MDCNGVIHLSCRFEYHWHFLNTFLSKTTTTNRKASFLVKWNRTSSKVFDISVNWVFWMLIGSMFSVVVIRSFVHAFNEIRQIQFNWIFSNCLTVRCTCVHGSWWKCSGSNHEETIEWIKISQMIIQGAAQKKNHLILVFQVHFQLYLWKMFI